MNHTLDYPVMVKPLRGGSSLGMSRVARRQDLADAVRCSFEEDSSILIEEWIEGRELTVGILGDEALPVMEIKTPREFYDFVAKYEDKNTQYLFPADLDAEILNKARKLALAAHHRLGCEAFSRVDFLLRDKDLFFLEVNAIPGLTSRSLLPQAAKESGLDFYEVCVQIIIKSLKQYVE